MSSICWLRHYFAEPYIEYVRWELSKRGLSKEEIRQHLAAHEHYEESIMTTNVPTKGCKDDWLAVLQEAHRYIIHYSTVRLSLVTFLTTAMLTAVLFSIPKETVEINSNSIVIYSGDLNWPALIVGIFFFVSALSLNTLFDRRRYVMEQFAADVESVVDAKIARQTTTQREHHLDKLNPQDVNVIISFNKDLESLYAEKFRGYPFRGKPLLNVFVTWTFLVIGIALVVLTVKSYLNAYQILTCDNKNDKFSCGLIDVPVSAAVRSKPVQK